MWNEISGGVCAAKGFTAAGVHCGVKEGSSPDKNDLALILSEKECTAAAGEGHGAGQTQGRPGRRQPPPAGARALLRSLFHCSTPLPSLGCR